MLSSDTYKVVKIISDKELVINGGSEHDVKRNDDFEIFERGVEVIDEETRASLGTLDYVKTVVTADTVHPKMSVCKKFARERRPQDIASEAFSREAPIKPASLNIDPQDISGGFEGVDKKIRVGDLARKSLN